MRSKPGKNFYKEQSKAETGGRVGRLQTVHVLLFFFKLLPAISIYSVRSEPFLNPHPESAASLRVPDCSDPVCRLYARRHAQRKQRRAQHAYGKERFPRKPK